jgi:hypothetical protein
VASSAGAEDVSFFELDDDKERVAPRVDVSSR